MSDFKKTGPKLDRMGFGGAPLGDLFGHSDDDKARDTLEPCLRALEEADPDVFLLATQYHLLNTAGADELFPHCLDRNVGVVVGAPFGSGLLPESAHTPAGLA